MITNNIDGALSGEEQYKKFNRALIIVLDIGGVTPDEYYAVMQLMNELPKTTALILDETYEDVCTKQPINSKGD